MVTLWFGVVWAASVDDFRACADGDRARCRSLGVELRQAGDARAWKVLERACEVGSAESCAEWIEANNGDPEIAALSCAAGHLEVCAWLGGWQPNWACLRGIAAGCDARMAGVRGGPVVTDAAFLDQHVRGVPIPADRGVLFVSPGDAITVTHVDGDLGVHLLTELRPIAVGLRLVPRALHGVGSALEMVLEERDGPRRLLVVEPGGSRLLPIDRRVCDILDGGWAMVDPSGACEASSKGRIGRQVDGKMVGQPFPSLPQDKRHRSVALLANTLAVILGDEVVVWGSGGERGRRAAPGVRDVRVLGDDLLVWFEEGEARWERWDGVTLATEWSAPSPGRARTLALSPDGRWIAAGGETLDLHDASTGLVAQSTRVPCSSPLWDGQGDLWCAFGESVVHLTAGAGAAARPPSDPAAWKTPAAWSEVFTGSPMSATIRGDGRPVAGARVRLGEVDVGTSDTAGRWRFDHAHGKLAALRVEAPGFLPWSAHVEVARPHDIELTPAVSVSYRLIPPPAPSAKPPRVSVSCSTNGDLGPSGPGATMDRLPRGATCRAYATSGPDLWEATFQAAPGASIELTRRQAKVDPRPTVRVQVVDAFGAPVAGVAARGRTSDDRGWLDLAEPGTDDALGLPGANPFDLDIVWRERGGEWTAYVDGVAVTVPAEAGAKWVARGSGVWALSPRPGDDGSVLWARPGDALALLVLDEGRASRSELTVDAEHRAFPAPTPSTDVLQVDIVGAGGLPEIGRSVQISWRSALAMQAETDLAGRIRVPTPYRGTHTVHAGGGATLSAEPGALVVLDVLRPSPKETAWTARPSPFGLRVYRARPEIRAAGPTWDDVVVEACGQDVRAWTWERLSEALAKAGGCDGVVLRDHDRVTLRLPAP